MATVARCREVHEASARVPGGVIAPRETGAPRRVGGREGGVPVTRLVCLARFDARSAREAEKWAVQRALVPAKLSGG